MARVFRFLKRLAFLAAGFAIFVVVMRLLFPLPDLETRAPSEVLPVSADTTLGKFALSSRVQHGGLSGMYPLFQGAEAFAARIQLARMAEESIDVRYYIWQRDQTGLPLLEALRQAAERGVRVRLLVDDNGTPELDTELAALNALENFEVRVFNPFNLRSPRLVSYLFDFPRLNRRMHNKSFTVDGAATIVGGRNVGDIYFSRASESQYSDFDLMLVGDAATDAGTDFDLYWNSMSAYPHELLVEPSQDGLAVFDAGVTEMIARDGWDDYRVSIEDTPLVAGIANGALPLEWVAVSMVSDDPTKGLGPVSEDQLMINQLAAIFGEAETSVDLISAYFIPGDRGTDILTATAARGVQVRTLTNSLLATDVLPVHAGYIRYRDRLIDAGVDVLELKPEQSPTQADVLGLIGSSASSLHAKTVALDGNRVFVGSFNFDPRSVNLNCEMGFLVESETLAGRIHNAFDERQLEYAYKVSRDDAGGVRWETRDDTGRAEVFTVEPGSSVGSRLVLAIVSLLPVEWML